MATYNDVIEVDGEQVEVVIHYDVIGGEPATWDYPGCGPTLDIWDAVPECEVPGDVLDARMESVDLADRIWDEIRETDRAMRGD